MATDAGKELVALVGRNIRQRRKDLGLTQGQVADRLSVEFETISRYERGVLAPSLMQLQRLADVLDVPVYSLLTTDTKITDVVLASAVNELPSAGKEFVVEVLRAYSVSLSKQKNKS